MCEAVKLEHHRKRFDNNSTVGKDGGVFHSGIKV